MFAVVFIVIVLELVASMGTFGALAAQNLFTNSAAGWYIRLDWTAVYAYAVSLLSTLVTLSLAIAALARNASRSGRTCSVFFSSGTLFILGFIFSVLWVVIAGFAYRNPLPMKYPCDIFRHLRGSLEILGIASGKSLIEEGGLLVGICQSSKAFLALAGIGLGLWVFLFVLSCASMVTGLNPPKKTNATSSSSKSVRSYISGLGRRNNSARNPQSSANYMEAGVAKGPAYPPATILYNQGAHQAQNTGYSNAYTVSNKEPFSKCSKCYMDNSRQHHHVPRKYSGRYANYMRHHCQPSATSDNYISKTPHLTMVPPIVGNTGNRTVDKKIEHTNQHSGLPDPRSAFATDGYSRDVSLKNADTRNECLGRVQDTFGTHDQAIDESHHGESQSVIGDEQHINRDKNNVAADTYVPCPHHRTDTPDQEYTADSYATHHQEHRYRRCSHSGSEHSPPSSQVSRKQRLRQLFGKDEA